MTSARRLDHVDPIVVVDYDPAWPAAYERAREEILGAAGDLIARIEHIGSTSVRGLAAKPVIDVLIALEQIERTFPLLGGRLAPLRYDARRLEVREQSHPFAGEVHGFLRRKVDGKRTHHLHVYEAATVHEGHVDLLFRDWLRSHPEDAAAYERLKREMARVHGADREAYVDSKNEIVAAILDEARAARRANG